MIPKIIHYCWFGKNPMPKEFEDNIATWRKNCPDYEFICWNEEKFDVFSVEYVKRAYQMKKYAFVSDYIRLYALFHYGGIYLDTDVELFKPLDCFLKHRYFMGRDRKSKSIEAEEVGTGLIGSEKNYAWLKEILDVYNSDQLFAPNDKIYLQTINWVMTAHLFAKKGFRKDNTLQVLDEGLTIYPTTFFSPMDYKTRRIYKTENTYAVHKYAGSWEDKRRKHLGNLFRNICGEEKYWRIKDKIAKAQGKKIVSS